jgi:hypothetical protein
MVTAISRRISKGWTPRTKGRSLGKRREEDYFPASHGNKRESELTLPYGYPSWEEEERNWRKRRGERRRKEDDKKDRPQLDSLEA